jgi:hypothetical protein
MTVQIYEIVYIVHYQISLFYTVMMQGSKESGPYFTRAKVYLKRLVNKEQATKDFNKGIELNTSRLSTVIYSLRFYILFPIEKSCTTETPQSPAIYVLNRLPHTVLSNQKVKSYLKEIADLCDINKTISFSFSPTHFCYHCDAVQWCSYNCDKTGNICYLHI